MTWDALEATPPGERTVHANLTQRQARSLFEGLEDRFPPVLTFEQAAELAQVSVSTLKGWFTRGGTRKRSGEASPGVSSVTSSSASS